MGKKRENKASPASRASRTGEEDGAAEPVASLCICGQPLSTVNRLSPFPLPFLPYTLPVARSRRLFMFFFSLFPRPESLFTSYPYPEGHAKLDFAHKGLVTRLRTSGKVRHTRKTCDLILLCDARYAVIALY